MGVAAFAFASMGIDLPLSAARIRYSPRIGPEAVAPLSRQWTQALTGARLTDPFALQTVKAARNADRAISGVLAA